MTITCNLCVADIHHATIAARIITDSSHGALFNTKRSVEVNTIDLDPAPEVNGIVPTYETKKKKILLVQPCHPYELGIRPSRWPVALIHLAMVLKDKNFLKKFFSSGVGIPEFNYKDANMFPDYDIEILDIQVEAYNNPGKSADEIYMEKLKNFNPNIVALTAVTPTIFEVRRFSQIAKTFDPDIKTFLGGIHASAHPIEAFEDIVLSDGRSIPAAFDYVIPGEGEFSWIEAVLQLSTDSPNMKRVRGCYIRSEDEDGTIQVQQLPMRETKHRLKMEEMPFPANFLDLIDIDVYGFDQGDLAKSKVGVMFSTRGCPYICTFCSSGNKKLLDDSQPMFVFDSRSAENIMEEITIMVEKKAITNIFFLDDTFIFSKQRALQLCDLIEEKKKHTQHKSKVIAEAWQNLKIYAMTNVKTLRDEALLDRLKEVGFSMSLALGVESPNPRVLDIYQKGISPDLIKQATALLKSKNIGVKWFLIIGPDEWEELLHTLQFILQYDPDSINVSYLLPYPGTVLEHQDQVSFVGDKRDYARYLHEPDPTRKSDSFPSFSYSEHLSAEEFQWVRDALMVIHKSRKDPKVVYDEIYAFVKKVCEDYMSTLFVYPDGKDHVFINQDLSPYIRDVAQIDLYQGLYALLEANIKGVSFQATYDHRGAERLVAKLKERRAQREGELGTRSVTKIINFIEKETTTIQKELETCEKSAKRKRLEKEWEILTEYINAEMSQHIEFYPSRNDLAKYEINDEFHDATYALMRLTGYGEHGQKYYSLLRKYIFENQEIIAHIQETPSLDLVALKVLLEEKSRNKKELHSFLSYISDDDHYLFLRQITLDENFLKIIQKHKPERSRIEIKNNIIYIEIYPYVYPVAQLIPAIVDRADKREVEVNMFDNSPGRYFCDFTEKFFPNLQELVWRKGWTCIIPKEYQVDREYDSTNVNGHILEAA